MRNFLDNSILEHKSKPPLRWIANVFGSIMTHAIWKVAILNEAGNFGWKYKIYGKTYLLTRTVYMKYGSSYTVDLDLSGKAWDDYDENGHAYWVYDWQEDPITGDAWRLIKNA